MPPPASLAASATWLALVGSLACVSPGQYTNRGDYESGSSGPEPAADKPLLSAHMIDYGRSGGPDDVMILVFADEVDPLGVVPEAFGVVRFDGQRVRPVEVRLGPADEGDENRSLMLIGEFGEPLAEPIAVHVLGNVFSEAGETFVGANLAIAALASADRLLAVQRLEPGEDRCPAAQQVLRTYWSDGLAGVGPSDLPTIELMLADGTARTPVDFDDQASREAEAEAEAEFGPADDNVLDLCVDVAVPVVRLRIAAGQFTDTQGHATAAAEVTLAAL